MNNAAITYTLHTNTTATAVSTVTARALDALAAAVEADPTTPMRLVVNLPGGRSRPAASWSPAMGFTGPWGAGDHLRRPRRRGVAA